MVSAGVPVEYVRRISKFYTISTDVLEVSAAHVLSATHALLTLPMHGSCTPGSGNKVIMV